MEKDAQTETEDVEVEAISPSSVDIQPCSPVETFAGSPLVPATVNFDELEIVRPWPLENLESQENSSSYLTIFSSIPPSLNKLGLDKVLPLKDPAETVHYTSPVHENLFDLDDIGFEKPAAEVSAAVKKIPGSCGLRNLGNTCFMNAGLQCLLNTPSLVQFFLEKYEAAEGDCISLSAKFAEFLRVVWSGQYSEFLPSDFKKTVGQFHPQFIDYRQHDCQEFLALLLDTLHEQLNTASSKSSQSEPCPSEAFVDNKLVEQPTAAEDPTSSKESETVTEKISAEEFGVQAPFISGSVSSSPHSSESCASSDASNSGFRLDPIPNDIEPFEDCSEAVPEDLELSNAIEENDLKQRRHSSLNWSPPTPPPKDPRFNQEHTWTNNYCEKKVEKNEIANMVNVNVRLPSIEDFVKETKILNTNVNIPPNNYNNEIVFDSDKFFKHELMRPRETLDNLNELNELNACSKSFAGKRIKKTNLLVGKKKEKCNKEVKEAHSLNSFKRIKIEEQCRNNLEESMETETVCEGETSQSGLEPPSEVARRDEALEADRQWDKYLAKNQSVVVDTFQGLLKSTVVCSVCDHVSVTYEPFMYLSVPLPRAMERQIRVVHIPLPGDKPLHCLLTLHKQDKVKKLKEQLIETLQLDYCGEIVVAEVLNNHVARVLDDCMLLQYMNTSNRKIYSFIPLTLPLPAETSTPESMATDEEPSSEEPLPPAKESTDNGASAVGGLVSMDAWKSCAICLEEMTDADLMTHAECGCVLCHSCLEVSCKHYGSDSLVCPVCSAVLRSDEDFIPISKLADYKPKPRVIQVSLVFRVDSGSGRDSSQRRLFGQPRMLFLPSQVECSLLYSSVAKFLPFTIKYSLRLVDGQGMHCSRCIYTHHCAGCEVSRHGQLTLQPTDTLCLQVDHVTEAEIASSEDMIQHLSLDNWRDEKPLTIYECLQAFIQSEVLDEHNPWFCPVCCRNQCARKSLTVWRYPDYLMVYLKRFVFHEFSSTKIDNKVVFPLEQLDLSKCVSNPCDPSNLLYDLYACVCHFGGVSSGHYTAYTKHAVSGDWYHYNDETTNILKPQDEDYSNAYILFYHRSGLEVDINTPGWPLPQEEEEPEEPNSSMEPLVQDQQSPGTSHQLDFYS